MGKKVDIVRRENKTSKKISTVRTAKMMDTLLKNVAARRSMGNNSHTVTRRVTKKRSTGRKKEMTKRREMIMSLKIYIMTSSSLAIMH